MSKEFIPYEEALALKELGFDGKCLTFYFKDSKSLFILPNGIYDVPDNYNVMSDNYVSAPLYQQAFRWFREKHNSDFYIRKEDGLLYFSFVFTGVTFEQCGSGTYEEAELACLRKLIEIINQNKDEKDNSTTTKH
jgi:hypothetical protein